ncbi:MULTISPECIES: PadR family transcriptional regulator [Actinomadura]|uniref:PadR family transcriptional regulator n=1 Tax=Actinomadura yumaensis TaxID=111807 RepID=A0ABW2D2I9_9ACTN|nr:helix-turn-helix transcriptional regulator [Actinomadura sp. J1-007]MWK39323.1 PadR family transcriptional regulator [Actinomadura sp. J1-007]
MTRPTLDVIRVFLDDPNREFYGLELRAATGLGNGTLYPRLAQLEGYGWLESRWEYAASDERAGRPPRRYYHLTREGALQARAAAERAGRTKRAGRTRRGSGLRGSGLRTEPEPGPQGA